MGVSQRTVKPHPTLRSHWLKSFGSSQQARMHSGGAHWHACMMASAAPVEHADSTPDPHYCMPSVIKFPAASLGSPRVWWALAWRSLPTASPFSCARRAPSGLPKPASGAVGGGAALCRK
eukprot:1625448-Prorocentrum_lima.AAC.1